MANPTAHLVVPLQGTSSGRIPTPRLKPGGKHGQAPAAPSLASFRHASDSKVSAMLNSYNFLGITMFLYDFL